jgi:hypothetical protein
MLSQQSREIIIICGVGLGTALGCAVAAVRKTNALRKALHWPSLPGTIIESRTIYGYKKCDYSIQYVFVAGHEVTGSTPRLSGDWFWSEKQMEAFVARYQVGQGVEVFYDPTNPKRNCIDREDRRGIQLLWVGVAVATICTALLVCCSLAYS